MVGVKPPGGRWMQIYAADIGRGPDGRWWVLGDRTQAPSGAGYALENRLVMARAMPAGYRRMNVKRLAPFFGRSARHWTMRRTEAAAHLPADARPVQRDLLRTGLPRALPGLPAGRGRRPRSARRQVYVRTIAGLKRADVLRRRVDPDFVDPLELNSASRLGAPDLIWAMRQRRHRCAQCAGCRPG